MALGNFKTGVNQREIVLDAKVTAAVEVGTIVTLTTDSSGNHTIAAATSNIGSAGQYIVAQSDMTMEYGHVPVEARNYAYSSAVKASTSAKKVALFRINDPLDINVIQ